MRTYKFTGVMTKNDISVDNDYVYIKQSEFGIGYFFEIKATSLKKAFNLIRHSIPSDAAFILDSAYTCSNGDKTSIRFIKEK